MQRTFAEARLLLGFDAGARQYIASVSETPAAVPSSSVSSDKPVLEQIRDAIRNGEKEEAARLMNDAIQEKMSPDRIIKEGLTAAMTEVGDAYGIGKVYLPQVMMAAEAMQSAFSELKVLLPSMKNDSKGTALLCTVQGDIHDLGKNIVAALLENSGYRVIDLGKDVTPQEILDAVLRHHAPAAGLSALMTTTVPAMQETIALLKEQAPWCKVVVGGAVLNQEYADRIGADRYAKDAMETIRYADKVDGAR